MTNSVPCPRCSHQPNEILPMFKDFELLCTPCKKQVWRNTVVLFSIGLGVSVGMIVGGILGLADVPFWLDIGGSMIFLGLGSLLSIPFILLLRLNWEKKP